MLARRTLGLVVLVTALAASAGCGWSSAQVHGPGRGSNWDRLSSIRPGTLMRVIRLDGSEIEGDLVTFSPTGLGLRTSEGRQTIRRAAIYQVYATKWWRNAGSSGAGTGAVVGGLGIAIRTKGHVGATRLMAVVGAAIGAKIDQAVNPSGWREFLEYQAEEPWPEP